MKLRPIVMLGVLGLAATPCGAEMKTVQPPKGEAGASGGIILHPEAPMPSYDEKRAPAGRQDPRQMDRSTPPMSAPKSAPPEILLRVETAELELGYPAGGVQLPPDEFRKLDLLLARPPLPHALRRVQVLIRVYEPLPEADLIELARQRASRLEIHLLKKGIKPASIRIESLLTPWVQPKDCGKKKSASICQPPQSTVRITLVPER